MPFRGKGQIQHMLAMLPAVAGTLVTLVVSDDRLEDAADVFGKHIVVAVSYSSKVALIRH